MANATCANCEQAVADAPFCSNCGQRMQMVPLRFRDLAQAAWNSLSSFEGPVFTTIQGLLLEPGRVARRWIDGKRTRYVHPVKFLFLVSLIIALSYEPLMALRQSLHVAGSPMYTVGLEGISPMFSLFGIVLPIPFALLAALLSRLLGVQLRWVEWYVLGAYATGMGALLQLVFKVLALPLPATWSGWLALAEFALPIALLIYGASHLVAASRRWRAVLIAIIVPVAIWFSVASFVTLLS